MATNEISSFTGQHAFLSNFFWEPDGTTAEHRFQACKTTNKAEYDAIMAAKTPAAAKRAGRKATLIAAWEPCKNAFMESVLRQKFSWPELAAALKATGDATLTEGNRWHDQYWGDCVCGRNACGNAGKNTLGRILMAIRAEL